MFDKARHHRRSIRLKSYDYTHMGAYFVTMVTQGRVCLFGGVRDGQMQWSEYGGTVHHQWHELPKHYAHLALDAFVVMPNHVHGIIVLTGGDPAVATTAVGAGLNVRAGLKPAPTVPRIGRHGLSEIVRAFKTFSARRINAHRNAPGVPVWQRNYYEHIIRDEESLNRIRQYITDNPLQWSNDVENPERIEAIA